MKKAGINIDNLCIIYLLSFTNENIKFRQADFDFRWGALRCAVTLGNSGLFWLDCVVILERP